MDGWMDGWMEYLSGLEAAKGTELGGMGLIAMYLLDGSLLLLLLLILSTELFIAFAVVTANGVLLEMLFILLLLLGDSIAKGDPFGVLFPVPMESCPCECNRFAAKRSSAILMR